MMNTTPQTEKSPPRTIPTATISRHAATALIVINIPGLMPVGGGCPIVENNLLVGGIGISGGDHLQDRQAAETALEALGFEVGK